MKLYGSLVLFSLCSIGAAIDLQKPLLKPSRSLPLLDLHKKLVDIPSVSGHELEVGDYLTKYLRTINLTVEQQAAELYPDVKKPRNNIYAYIGKERHTRVLLTSHIDTVPPFLPYKKEDDVIWGRGSVDAKGSVATQIKAFEELRARGDFEEGDVGLLFVVGEEVGGDGMKKANDLGIKWESVIFGEPTELKLASGHKGGVTIVIKAHGKAGHSGYPETGKSANAMIIPALYGLLNAQWPSSEKYGNTTINIGTINGGVAANVLPAEAEAKILIRIADGTPADIEKIVIDTLHKTGEKFELEARPGYGPVPLDADVPGFETIVVNYGTDVPNLKGDHKRYLYGPGTILEAHSAHEHLQVKDLEEAVEGYKKLMQYSLKQKS